MDKQYQNKAMDRFRLDNKVVVVTGGAGLMGGQHIEAIAEAGGVPIIWDINVNKANDIMKNVIEKFNVRGKAFRVDLIDGNSIKLGLEKTLEEFGNVDVLINNAANNPHIKKDNKFSNNNLETYPLEIWNKDIEIGLTSAFLCSQVVGEHMSLNGGGIILNVASDLAIISPDQRIYKKEGIEDGDQFKKPVSYSVIKHGIIGLTKYMATYWADKNIRVNSISPGGIFAGQDSEFVEKLTNLIPMGRMANMDEYKSTIIYLISEASSYVTGTNLIADGGRTCW